MSTFRCKTRFLRSFCKNRFLSIKSQMSIFREKLHYIENILKKSFSIHKSVNVKISSNITLFWDHFEKVVFCQYTCMKISTFREKLRFCLFRVFPHKSVNINITRRRFFCGLLWNILPHYCVFLNYISLSIFTTFED